MGGYSLYHVKLDGGKTVVANVSSLALGEIDSPTWDDEVYVRWSASAGVVLTVMKRALELAQRAVRRFDLTGRTRGGRRAVSSGCCCFSSCRSCWS